MQKIENVRKVQHDILKTTQITLVLKRAMKML